MMNKTLILSGALLVSLALNFTLGGMVIGRGMMMPPPPPRHHNPMERMQHKLEKLPDAAQKQARDIFDSYRPQMEEAYQAMKTARKESFAFIQSKEYTRIDAEKQMQGLREKSIAMQNLVQKMLLDMADKLSPEQRSQLLKRDKPDHRPPPPSSRD